MKRIKLLTVLAVLGMASLTTTALATSDIVNFKFTVLVQGPQTTSGSVTKYTIAKAIKVTTKDVMNLVGNNYAHPDGFYDGALLVENGLFSFSIYNGDPNNGGTNLLDISTSLLSMDYGNYMYNEVYHNDTTSYTYSSRYLTYVSFDDGDFNNNGDFWDFTGFTKYSFNFNGTNSKFTESFSAVGELEGTVDGEDFVATGSISGKGKGLDL